MNQQKDHVDFYVLPVDIFVITSIKHRSDNLIGLVIEPLRFFERISS